MNLHGGVGALLPEAGPSHRQLKPDLWRTIHSDYSGMTSGEQGMFYGQTLFLQVIYGKKSKWKGCGRKQAPSEVKALLLGYNAWRWGHPGSDSPCHRF